MGFADKNQAEPSGEVLFTVTANFTAEPLGDVLHFWFARLALEPVRLVFSDYNQIFQELMTPNSASASKSAGVNFFLIRLEDWARDQQKERRIEAVATAVRDFSASLAAFAQRAFRPSVVVLCPSSPAAATDPEFRAALELLELETRQAAAKLPGVTALSADDVRALYPVEIVDDPEGDREAHIPFTPVYWSALGTTLARTARSLLQPPYKLIVVDADNTLWDGVVGEVGASRVEIGAGRRDLQKLLRDKRERGMLLALASKNSEKDVAAVFQRTEMVLRREDFVAWKINWDSKSRNVASLAKELELGLNSFIFLDDNPVECAEVAANCPNVTTLLVPGDPAQIPEFLRHLWAFDLGKATSVDRKRTELYRQQGERNQFRSGASTFRDFLNGLQLQVLIAPLSPPDYDRAAQLTQRTNQFNNTLIRRTAAELSALLQSGERSAFILRVRDRFGDYGVVGLAVFFVRDDVITVETLLMSCRVLGKGVEHQFLASLGREALRVGAHEVAIPFKAADRNQPAEKFLKSINARVAADGSLHLSAADAAAIVLNPENASGDVQLEETSEEGDGKSSLTFSRPDFAAIASDLNSAERITEAISRQLLRARPQLPHELVQPRNLIEQRLAKIWSEVLHLDAVGVTDQFLSLGGRSLPAASIASRIAGELGVKIPLIHLLSNPTIAELSKEIGSGHHAGDDSVLPKALELSLSPAQQRLRFLDQFIPYRAAYNIPVARRLRGKLDIAVLESALSDVMLRHDVLRSSFPASDGLSGLKISAGANLHVRHLEAPSEAEALKLADEESRQPFDLAEGPLLRCVIISFAPEDHILVLNVHHIVSDGWSMGILLRDLSNAYAAESAKRKPSWAPLPNTYADYSAWQRARIASDDFHGDLEYWKQELRGTPSLLEMPTDKPRPPVMTYAGSAVRGELSKSTRDAIEKVAQREQCTTFTVLLAAWRTFLQRYSQQEDIVVGVPVAGRTHPATERLVGCFVNTLAIRTSVDHEASFLEGLRTVRGKVLQALSHQELPFESLVSELGLPRDLSRSPLFQVMLVLQDTPYADFHAAGLNVKIVPVHNGGAKFDLVLEVTPASHGFALALEFNTSLFLPGTASQMLRHFTHLLEQACAAPETTVAALPMMDDREVRQMVSFANGNAAVANDQECLHHVFERRAETSPRAIALSCDDEKLSYDELNRRANRLAHYLIAAGLGPDVLVGVCLDRANALVITILAVLKAGGAYLPIDLSYPAQRLAFMLEDAQAPVLLTERKLIPSLPKHSARTICLEDVEESLATLPATNPETAVKPENLAYVIYTSGSTGKPKGCMIAHRNVVRLMRATEPWFQFNERDVWTLFHSSAFDFSVWEIWGALLYGGRLVVVPFLVTRSPEAFYELLAKEQVTVLNQTPSAFRQLIQAEESVGQRPLPLRYVIFGGEALEMESLRPWFDRHGDKTPKLVNMYGITETTVHVTYRALAKNDLSSGSMIGVPIPDLRIYVLDPKRQPAPIGVPGELYVGGAGLARGYLNRAELTAERFVPDHLTGEPGSRLYKTGDLVRFLRDGDIEYLGRIDQQVKIRGFRIELGEIESVLRQHPAVREVTVIAREDVPGTKQLVAYLVTSLPAPGINALRDHLKVKLPDYMVPAAFVFLERLPLTNNGKIDRKALPVPEQQRPEVGSTYEAPRTPNEEKLAAIWAKALRIERVGIHDNFFELGGDSILSIQIISAARREGLKLTPKLLFAHQNIAELANVAEVADDSRRSRELVAGDVPLTPIQHWFFEQNLEESHYYNQAFLLEVAEKLNRSLLESALKELSRHHDALRLRYVRDEKGWRQFYAPSDSETVLTWENLERLDKQEQERAIEAAAIVAQKSLHLQNGPLWRVAYFSLGAGLPDRLFVVVHHLAVDGISWHPLLEDLEAAYRQLEAKQTIQLPTKTSSYKTWTERLAKFAAEKFPPEEVVYWKNATDPCLLAEFIKPFANAEKSRNTEGSAETYKVTLAAEETIVLLQRVPSAYNTQINDVLLTALARAWNLLTGSCVLFTNLEGHGRENLFDDVDLSRTVGWFTSIFPVRLELPKFTNGWQPDEALKSVKEQLLHIPRRGIGYGILHYLGAGSSLSSRAEAEPPIVFNYLGQFDHVLGDSKLLRFAREASGSWHSPKQRRRFQLEINSVVTGGRLEISWTYSRSSPPNISIERLADEFLASLRELIVHCSSPEARGRTCSDFPLAKLDQPTLDELYARFRDIEDIYPLSPIQTLFFSANRESSDAPFDQWHCTLCGQLNVSTFQRAWQETLRRHPVLRSTIHAEGLREPLQIVHRDVRLPWTVEDWRDVPHHEQAARWTAFLEHDRAVPLPLTEGPALRFALVRLSEDTWRFLWSVPPLLLDGWSWPIVYRDASRLYEAFSRNVPPQLEPVGAYRDYIDWLGKQSSTDAQTFWRNNLAGFRAPIPFPTEAPEAAGSAPERNLEHVFELSTEATAALQSTARRLQITVNSVVQSAWALQLSRQAGISDVVFGAAFSGRPADLRCVESIVGPFVNNLPVRVPVKGESRTSDFLRQVHATSLDLSSVQFTPLMEIQSSSEVPWRYRLFDNVIVFQNYLVDESARNFGGQIKIADFVGPIHTNFPVMLLVEPGASLRLALIYDPRIVARTTIERWARDLTILLTRVPEFLERTVADLQSLLSPALTASARKLKLRFRAESQNFIPPQTEMERTIAGVWQGMFGLDRISIEENFFDLGGHSVLLVQMHNRLRETLNTEFPIVILFEHPTVRSLAGHLDRPAVTAQKMTDPWKERAQKQKRAVEEIRRKLGKS